MIISKVACHLTGSQSDDGAASGNCALVRVETDTGYVGHGESLMGLFCGEIAVELTRYYEPLLIGRSALDIDAVVQELFTSSIWWGRSGAPVSVIGAIEMALWDIAGQVAGKPCYQLFTNERRQRMPVYASLGAVPVHAQKLAEMCEQLKSRGFRALKLGLQYMADSGEMLCPRGDQLRQLLTAALDTCRNSLGSEFILGVDGHMGGVPDPIDPREALQLAEVLAQYNVNFFEEPLSYRDVDGYAWLRERSPVRIAGGESLSLLDGFQPFVDRQALDVLQPDANFVGGLSQARSIATLAEQNRLSIIPHSWCVGPGTMANTHFAFFTPAVERLEVPPCFNSFQQRTLVEPPIIQDGCIGAPTAPGLGIRFEPEWCDEFRYEPQMSERASGVMIVSEAK